MVQLSDCEPLSSSIRAYLWCGVAGSLLQTHDQEDPSKERDQSFVFDRIFGNTATNQEIYQEASQPAPSPVFENVAFVLAQRDYGRAFRVPGLDVSSCSGRRLCDSAFQALGWGSRRVLRCRRRGQSARKAHSAS